MIIIIYHSLPLFIISLILSYPENNIKVYYPLRVVRKSLISTGRESWELIFNLPYLQSSGRVDGLGWLRY